eukprot:4261816-Amphidinium_carterae.1
MEAAFLLAASRFCAPSAQCCTHYEANANMINSGALGRLCNWYPQRDLGLEFQSRRGYGGGGVDNACALAALCFHDQDPEDILEHPRG